MWAGQRQIRLRTYWFFLCEKKDADEGGGGKQRLEGATATSGWCADGGSEGRDNLVKITTSPESTLTFTSGRPTDFRRCLCSLDNCMTTPWLDVDFVLITTFTRAWKLHKTTSTWLAVDFQWTLPDYLVTTPEFSLNFRFYWVWLTLPERLLPNTKGQYFILHGIFSLFVIDA